ncbi:glucans biosynthesis glucosyltransferase MdoH [Halovulum dunhuangense]|nr:glucans biosynthesis glucosyltransferase MdoH [Halovulum dunhuangense]
MTLSEVTEIERTGWPVPAALEMPPRSPGERVLTGPGVPEADRPVRRARLRLAALTAAFALPLTAAFLAAIDGPAPVVALLVALFGLNAAYIAAGAAMALLGLGQRRRAAPVPASFQPAGRIAVLWLVCGEAPLAIARRVSALRRDLDRSGLGGSTDIWILSDTRTPEAAAAEEQILAPLAAQHGIHYRRRTENVGRKPGNVADWVTRQGSVYETMLVMDADSQMTADRIRALQWRMEQNPHLGLIQTGMRLVSGESRFAALQRLSSRLCGPGFTRGLAGWTGTEGNFWGHNALIRVRAFAASAGLAPLSGPAPFGGPILSHDFIEAAWLRRSGWGVEVEPSTLGSAEEAPETLGEFHRRDRRWCQGNLQHVRLLGARGLHPISRLHLMGGIQSYLSAPIWLAMVLILALGGVELGGNAGWPLAGALALLMVPKLAGIGEWVTRRRGRARWLVVRAGLTELALSSLIAPIVMLNQSRAVAEVLLGRDCGWKGPQRRPLISLPRGGWESLSGLALIALAAWFSDAPEAAALLLAPVALPLVAAPLILRFMDAPKRPAPRARIAHLVAAEGRA